MEIFNRKLLEPNEIYKRLLNSVYAILKQNGYRRRNANFSKQNSSNLALIGFQRCTHNYQGYIRFTINFTIYSQEIQNFMQSWDPDSSMFSMYNPLGHWGGRIECFPPYDHQDNKWFTITSSSLLEKILAEVLDPVNKASLELEKFINRNDLLDLWKSNQDLIVGSRALHRIHRLY